MRVAPVAVLGTSFAVEVSYPTKPEISNKSGDVGALVLGSPFACAAEVDLDITEDVGILVLGPPFACYTEVAQPPCPVALSQPKRSW